MAPTISKFPETSQDIVKRSHKARPSPDYTIRLLFQ
jgi:hypothetical protein